MKECPSESPTSTGDKWRLRVSGRNEEVPHVNGGLRERQVQIVVLTFMQKLVMQRGVDQRSIPQHAALRDAPTGQEEAYHDVNGTQ